MTLARSRARALASLALLRISQAGCIFNYEKASRRDPALLFAPSSPLPLGSRENRAAHAVALPYRSSKNTVSPSRELIKARAARAIAHLHERFVTTRTPYAHAFLDRFPPVLLADGAGTPKFPIT